MKKVTAKTIIRTVVLIIALVNQILVACGLNVLPINDEQVAELISLLFTIGASMWAWWKNNSFTAEAITADEYLKELKHENTDTKAEE